MTSTSSRRRRALAPLLLLTLLGAPATVSAAVPGAKTVLQAAAKAQPLADTVQANLIERPAEGPPRTALRIVSDGKGRVRLEVQDLATATSRTTWYGPTGGADSGSSASPTRVLPLFEAPAWLLWLVGHPVAQIARDKQVDVERTALARAESAILWVVGAGPRELERPQLHVERVTGRLRRAVETRNQSARPEVLDARLEGQQAAEGPAARWPARVRLVQGTRASVLWEVTWLRLGEAIDAAELSPPAGSAPAPAPAAPASPPPAQP